MTTVRDLLRWNEHFVRPTFVDDRFLADEQTPGHFADGRVHDYAPGLYVRPYRGVREVSHSGSTAGYRAFLARYPAQHFSIAVLCNAGDAGPTQYAHEIAEVYLGRLLKPEEPPRPRRRRQPSDAASPPKGNRRDISGNTRVTRRKLRSRSHTTSTV